MLRIEIDHEEKCTLHMNPVSWEKAVEIARQVNGRIIVDNPEKELVFLDWNDYEDHASYSCWDYFDDGVYLGKDDWGIEPLFDYIGNQNHNSQAT